MKRYFLFLKFKGTDFHGWQSQPNGNTIQAEIEKALAVVFQAKIAIMGAGRTDTGVHASSMIAHFDVDKSFDSDNILFHLNNLLPDSISIDDIKEVHVEFHARFAATSRTYSYFIIQDKNPFSFETTHRFSKKLDVTKMNKAAQLLLGEYDFSCFSKSKTQTFTNDCTIERAEWIKTPQGLTFEIKANRFLRNMVRAIVGTLLEVGEGKRESTSIPDLIASKNRSNAGTSVPAKGLFLVDIEYPNEGFI